MNYRLAYAIGFHPWEDLAEHPPFADKLLELVAREENGHGPPHGRALDLGTGSAVWGVRLARRGWDVTCIDIVEKALRRARERADDAGAEVRLVHADVTAMREAGLGSGFRLLLDTGTFHGLGDAQRAAMGEEVTALAAPDATLILDCFAPRRRGFLPRGASRADVERAFPGWEITDVEVADTAPDALARLMKFDERFYRLRRTAGQPRRSAAAQGRAEHPVRVELSRRFGVTPREGFDFITDPSNWPRYWPGLVRIEAGSRWREPGDRARLVLRLLGRDVELEMTLGVLAPYSAVEYVSVQRGLPDALHERHFEDADGGLAYRIVVSYQPRPGWRGVVDRVLVRRAVARAARKTLANLDRCFGEAGAALDPGSRRRRLSRSRG